jgi:NAD(P)-dependent dehydrogenase (short-subunit alcohol dehydrogenase family)
MKDLDGAVALITGAAGDIGQAIAKAFTGAGAQVVAADLAGPRGELPLDWQAMDVTDEADWARVIDHIRTRYGRLDVLVNNAGVALMDKLEDMPLERWRRVQAINVDGYFLGTKATTGLLRESGSLRKGGAAIVNLVSGAADRPAAFSAAYCASKAAAAMLTRAAAVEFAALGYPIRVNSVHPGVVASAMMDAILERYSEITGGTPVESLRESVVSSHPMKRFVEPDEVAEAALFLASPRAGYIHGEALHVDGGYAAS